MKYFNHGLKLPEINNSPDFLWAFNIKSLGFRICHPVRLTDSYFQKSEIIQIKGLKGKLSKSEVLKHLFFRGLFYSFEMIIKQLSRINLEVVKFYFLEMLPLL